MRTSRGAARRLPGSSPGGDPFRVLGLVPGPELTGDDIRAAWRRVATATHPDRADGGDPDHFAAAAAAYTALRTPSGRGEVLADLSAARPPIRGGSRRSGRYPAAPPLGLGRVRLLASSIRLLASRIRGGRPGRLALRVAAVLAVSAAAAAAIGLRPATPALVTGAITWLIRTGRRDLAPRPMR